MLKYKYGGLLSRHTTLNIGGPVFCWLEPANDDELLESITFAEDNEKALAIIGKGSNILARETGFDGIIINLEKGFNFIEKRQDDAVMVGAGCPLSILVKKTAEWNLAGCEFLSGIPGSFGGALFMNAGVRDIDDTGRMIELKDIVLDADVMDMKNRKRETLRREDIAFSYRSSGLEGKCIIAGRLKLRKSDRGGIEDRMSRFMKRREWIQALGFPSAGSVFKNPVGAGPAGRLIEECGLKGARIGDAEISGAHGNFIVNLGKATSGDVIRLIELVKDKVRHKFGIDLELELKVI